MTGESYRILRIPDTRGGVERWLVEYYSHPDSLPNFLCEETNEFMDAGRVPDYCFFDREEAVRYLYRYLTTHQTNLKEHESCTFKIPRVSLSVSKDYSQPDKFSLLFRYESDSFLYPRSPRKILLSLQRHVSVSLRNHHDY